MSTVAEIEAAIRALPPSERERLAALGRVGWAEEECVELRRRAQAVAARRQDVDD